LKTVSGNFSREFFMVVGLELKTLGTDFPAGSINGVHCFGHSGGSIGMNGDLEIFPVPGYVVIVLANMDPPVAGEMSLFIASRLPEK
jgi:hypothetical protein